MLYLPRDFILFALDRDVDLWMKWNVAMVSADRPSPWPS